MIANATEVVGAFIAAINRRSPAEIAELMAENYTFVDSTGVVESGRQKMSAGWKEFFRLFPDYAMQVETILVQGEVVAVFGSVSGTYNGKRGLVSENNIAMPAAWRGVVQNGKVARWQVYADWTAATRTMADDAKAG
jgi:ketosteroid isomerase-like protein